MSNKNLEQVLEKKQKTLNLIYVSTYIPRKCGIATYTKDLTNDINQLNPHALTEIMALNKNGEELNYPWETKYKINQDELISFLRAADYINQSSADIVCLQHEYGLFGGKNGDYVIPFIESIKKPLVCTFHTVVQDANSELGNILKRIVTKSDAVVVMMKETKNRLVNDYKLNGEKIVVIPHGTPDLPLVKTEGFKKTKRLSGRIILGNINLLSSIKGIEYALEAVAKIAKEFPNVLYLVIGQTHPSVLKYEKEKYRNSLKKIVRKFNIEKNVKFINEYVTLEELIDWLKVIDYYVTPYLDPQQSSSGALAYAIGAGKICISTPYLYAKEALNNERGILVPFKDSQTIASSIIKIEKNPEEKKKMEKKAYDYGRLMTWSNVAQRHLDLFRAILNKNGNG